MFFRFIKRKIKGGSSSENENMKPEINAKISFIVKPDLDLYNIMNHSDSTTRNRMQSIIDICEYLYHVPG